jgi:hypothetical protein
MSAVRLTRGAVAGAPGTMLNRHLRVPAASVPAASVPTIPYGTGAPDALEPVAEQTLEHGVLEGRTLFAATVDTGSSCPVLVLGPDAGAGNGVGGASRRWTTCRAGVRRC